MIKILFWTFVTLDAVILVIFGLLGLAAAGPSRTNPIAALVIPFFIPAAFLAGAIWLFLSSPGNGGRACAILLAASPFLFVVGSKASVLWELRAYRDSTGQIREFRTESLRAIEDAIVRNDAAAVAAAARGVDLNTPGLSGATVLVLATRQLRNSPKQLDVIRALLAAGADPNVSRVELPLQGAIAESRTLGLEPVRLLLDAGANPNALGEGGDPVFFIAAGADIKPEVMELLIARGADLQLRDKAGGSAVVLAALTSNWPVLELLLRRGTPWQDQRCAGGVPFLDYMEGEARHGRSHRGGTNKLSEVMALLRARKA